jgi:hypothetical protein
MAAIIGFYLSGVIAIAIIFIGCRFLLAPSTAAAAYGVPAGVEPHSRAYLSARWASGHSRPIQRVQEAPHAWRRASTSSS